MSYNFMYSKLPAHLLIYGTYCVIYYVKGDRLHGFNYLLVKVMFIRILENTPQLAYLKKNLLFGE